MHEFSIAVAVVGVAERHAAGRRVVKIELRVGHLRQVVPDSLQLAFELITQGTVLDGTELEIEQVPARARCPRCGAESELEHFPLACEACGSLDLELLTGEELLVESLELEEEPDRDERIGHAGQI